MATQGQVTKIYELRTQGFDELHKQLLQLRADFEAIKKSKQDLENQKSKLEDPTQIDELNKKLLQTDQAYDKLQQQINSLTKFLDNQSNGTSKLSGQWTDLISKYQQAKQTSDELLQSQGEQSDVYQKAAAATDAYRQQILSIIDLSKKVQKAQPPVQVSEEDLRNIAELKVALTDKNKQLQAEAQLNAAAENSNRQYRAEIKLLTLQRDQLNDSTEEGRKKIAEYNAQIDENNEKIKQNVSLLEKQKINIGNYEGSAKVIVDALQKVEDKIAELQVKQQGLQNLGQSNPIGFKVGGGQENLNQITAQITSLQTQAKALTQITSNPTFLNFATKIGDTRGEISLLQRDLVQLRQAGLENTDAFKEIQDRLADLTRDFRETRQEVKALSSETRGFDLFASSVNLVTSSLQTAAGAEAIFGDSSEETGKKIQQLIAITSLANGTREIARQITEKGTAANRVYNFVLQNTKNIFDSNATAGSRFFSVLKLGLAGIAVGAVLLLIANFDKLNNEEKRLEDGLRNLNGVSSDSKRALSDYGKTIGDVVTGVTKELTSQTKSLNDELGKTPRQLDQASAALQLATNDLKKLKDEFQGTTGVKNPLQGLLELITFGQYGETKINEATLKILKLKDAITELTIALSDKRFVDDQNLQLTRYIESANLEIDANNRILSNVKSTEQEKIKAVTSTFSLRKQIITDTLQQELNSAGKDTIKQNQAQIKSYNDYIKNSRDLSDALRKIREEALQNNLRDIDAQRDQLLAQEELKRRKNNEEEETYLKNILQINQDAIDNKLKLIKGANAEERKQIAQLQLDKVKNEQDTNDKIFEIRSKALTRELQQQIADIQLQRDQEIKDPTISETQRSQIKLDADNKILQLQIAFNQKIDALEKQLGIRSVDNAKQTAEDIKKTKEQILKDQEEATLAGLKDAQAAGEKSIAQFRALINQVQLAIAQSQKITPNQRTKFSVTVSGQESIGVLAREVDSLQKQLPIYKSLLDQKKITDTDYANFVANLNDKEKQLLDAFTNGITGNLNKLKAFYKTLLDAGKITKDQYDKLISDLSQDTANGVKGTVKQIKSASDLLQSGIDNLFNIDENTDEGKLINKGIGEAIAETYQVAQSAMNNYFDAERQRINDSLQLHLNQIDADKQQAEARAQSQAEIDSIEKQAAAKKKAAQKQAGEELKKSKKSEAKIALAVQLMNVAVEASQYPFPANLIIGGILAGLALANYAIQVSAINREQFAFGGQPGKKPSAAQRAWTGVKKVFGFGGKAGEVPAMGGKFGGKSHKDGGTPFTFKDREYEAEIEEIAVIRTRNAPKGKKYTVTGTQTQIASAINTIGGGHDFAPGASVKEEKNIFVNTINRMFGYGGQLKEKKSVEDHISNIHENKVSTDKKTTEAIYSSIVNHVMNENKTLVERKDHSAITNLVSNEIKSKRSSSVVENTELINRIVTEKLKIYSDKVYSVTGNTREIFKSLHSYAKEEFAFGGNVPDVPIDGGKFGGKPHSQGGTDFEFKGKTYNAQVDELAVIRTRDAKKNKKYTVTGDQMQIASFANVIGGGVDFKPGASVKRFATGGIIGESLQAPIYIPSGSNNSSNEKLLSELKRVNDKLDAQVETNKQLATEQSKRIDRLQVQQVTQTVTDAQRKQVKQSSIGSLP